MEASCWQTKFSSLRERNMYALNKSLFCDVEFSVKDANGHKVTYPAHKSILAISSPVFEAMLYGELAGIERTVDLPDCTKEGLQELLRYVYSDEVNLTGSNVLEVLYQAEKYMLPFLKKKCEEYLEEHLKPEDVFYVLPHIRDEKLEQKCWDMVDDDTERAVCSKSFHNTSQHMLCRVLGRDTISVDEVVLFQEAEKWALNKIKQKGCEESGQNKRAVLGDEAVKLIRFPLMSERKFAEKVLPSGILLMEEVTEIISFYNKLVTVTKSFSNKRRGKYDIVIPINRFKSILKPMALNGYWSYNSGESDAIDFKVSKPIFLAGVRLFGSEDSTYTVTNFTLYKGDMTLQQIQSSTIPTECEQTDGYYGYNILFDKPVALNPDVVYTISATISGPASYYGEEPIEDNIFVTLFEDIVVKYMSSNDIKSKNRTTLQMGQFPTLIFKRLQNHEHSLPTYS